MCIVKLIKIIILCCGYNHIGETPDSLHEGKLVICTVTGIARRRPQRDVIAQSNPINDQRTGFWQCPFCLRADFHNISLVIEYTLYMYKMEYVCSY